MGNTAGRHGSSLENPDQHIIVDETKHPVQVSESDPSSEWDIVVALDIGTRFSGYAFSDKQEIKRNNINLNIWRENTTMDQRAKVPTVVLLKKNKEFDSFGYEAEENYAKHVANRRHTEYYRFRNFKMRLYHEKKINEKLEILDDRNAVSVPEIDIFAFTIKALKDHFEKAIEDSGVPFDSNNVLYVVTVPAIWTESAKEFMKKAAFMAGICEHQLLIALEPEAAALFCRTLPEHMQNTVDVFKPGEKYMVLDLGGGTVDIIVHKILDDGKLAEVYKASGGPWGGTVVDTEFRKFVNALFKNDNCIEDLWNEAPMDALDLEREFEAKKRNVTKENTSALRLQLPQRLHMFSNTNLQGDNRRSITFAHMYIQSEEFRSFFIAARNEIIKTIEKILKEVENVNSVILVGGFSGSAFLRDEIRCHFHSSKINFITPRNPDVVVLQGAVLFGYNPRAVSARVSRYTYGISVLRAFDEKIHPRSNLCLVDGEKMCEHVFKILAFKDDLLQYDEVKTFNGISNHRSPDRKRNSMKIEMFQAKNVAKDELAFVTEERCVSIGKIVFMPPQNGWPDTVEYEAKFYFGRTNVRIEAQETANKVKINTSFELD